MSVDNKINSAMCDGKVVRNILQEDECAKITNKNAKNLDIEDRWPFLISKPPEVHLDITDKNFITYDIDNFLQLRSDLPPKNKYVRTAGYVHIEQGTIYLRSRENLCRRNVKIKLGSSADYPEPGTLIEVFGKLYFEKTEKKCLPYVQVYFHRKLTGSYAEYVELFQILKTMR